MSGWLEDFKYAFRQVRSNPRLLLLVIAILGIGIGANTTIYSLIEAAGHLPVRADLPAWFPRAPRYNRRIMAQTPWGDLPVDDVTEQIYRILEDHHA